MRIANKRLYAELAWPHLLIVGVCAVLAAWLAFQAGARFGGRSAPARDLSAVLAEESREPAAEPSAASITRPAEPRSLSGAHRPAADVSVATPPPAEREPQPAEAPSAAPQPAPVPAPLAGIPEFQAEPGYSYLLVQHFPAGKVEDANAAARFLQEKGLPCALRRGEREVVLFVTEPFRLYDGTPAQRKAERARFDDLRQNVLTLGKEFFKLHLYDFRGCYRWP